MAEDRRGVLTLEHRAALGAIMAGTAAPHEPAPALVAAVLKEGRLANACVLGERTLDPSAAMRPWTKMRVASISKLALAYGLMGLWAEGLIDLDADVSDLLGFGLRNPAYPDVAITLRHLLTHVSSLRDGETYQGWLGEPISAYFLPGGARYAAGAQYDAAHPPGAFYEYCNIAYGVIASVMERAAGERIDALMLRRVFAPLGLSCGYNWSGVPAAEMAEGAALYRPAPSGGFTASIDAPDKRRAGPMFAQPGGDLAAYRPGDNGLLFSPQGGLRASLLDLAALAEVLIGRGAARGVRIVPEAAFQPLLEPVRAEATLGAQILEYAGRRLIGHGAEAYGLIGGLWTDPDDGSGFIALVTGGPEARAPGDGAIPTGIEAAMFAVLADAAFG